MNNQLIEKIIKSNNEPCPEFAYENPLLDLDVAKALSKSFVKILNITQQNSNVSNNLRLSILENMRKLCRMEPENHLKMDENFTNLLTEVYLENCKTSSLQQPESIEKNLDAFLIRRMKEMNLKTLYESSHNPEIIQALINLNQAGVYLKSASQDIIHWNSNNGRHLNLLRNLWTNEIIDEKDHRNVCDDVSIKLRSEIETLLLEVCHNILIHRELKIEDVLSNNMAVKNLLLKSAESAECFQICCGIFNFLFIMTNFDSRIQKLVKSFIDSVKKSCTHITISVLYPIHISHIVVLMDFDIDVLPIDLRNNYVESTLKYLSELKSESDIVLLLSHFPHWFDVYVSCSNSL